MMTATLAATQARLPTIPSSTIGIGGLSRVAIQPNSAATGSSSQPAPRSRPAPRPSGGGQAGRGHEQREAGEAGHSVGEEDAVEKAVGHDRSPFGPPGWRVRWRAYRGGGDMASITPQVMAALTPPV